MADENRAEGTARNFGGRVQDAVGAVTGDTATQARGQMNRAAGSALVRHDLESSLLRKEKCRVSLS